MRRSPSAAGSALRTVDASGRQIASVSLGSYPGWTANAISDGPDGLTRLLRNNSDGRTGVSLVSSSGILATARYGADVGWTAVNLAVGGDGLTRVLRVHESGRVALQIVDDAGAIRASGPVYSLPAGLSARRVCAGTDGSTRILFADSGQTAVVWLLSSASVFQASFVWNEPEPPDGISGTWLGKFDSADFVDCDSNTPAHASFTQKGSTVTGILDASENFCGFGGVVFQGTLNGNTLTGAVSGDRFNGAVAAGTLSGATLEITITNGFGFIPGGRMHLHR